jgi:DMSO/TMAO reductase YedYZ molybdopterin-dependent catalytic subunit
MGGLAVAELVAAASTTLQSPVLDVGDRVVDAVPRPVKDLAIEWFGTNDKIALLAGIGMLLGIYAAAMGIVAIGRRPRLAVIGAALFGLIGACSSVTTRRQAPFVAVVPSVVGALVAAVLLVVLRRAALGSRPVDASTDDAVEPAPPAPSIAQQTPNDRRRFLAVAGLTAAGAFVVGTSGRRLGASGAGTSRRSLTLPRARRPLEPAPAGVSVDIEGVSPFYTPNDKFYRIDTALTVPQVTVDDWSLTIDGMVDRPLRLSFDDLMSREIVEADITLTCVSNEVGGKLVGNARWLGVRLDALLNEVGVSSDADQIVGRSVDGYTCGFPVSSLDGRDALVAVGMNGEPLPLQHGFPARLIVPGLYGYVSATKWLTRIELTRFDRFDQYWVERGWDEQAPIKTQSRIDTPRGLARVPAGPTAIAGVAWAQLRGITKVEVRVDDGPWVEATLADELNVVTWRQWSYAWDATPGRHSITVRATDGSGAIQTDARSEPFPNGATGHHQIVVIVD